MYKKYLAGAVVAASMAPALALAQTADVSAQIQALLDQIHALQLQIKALIASSTAQFAANASSTPPFLPPGEAGKIACIELGRNLHIGDRGDDVKELQEFLDEDDSNEFSGAFTGFFGPLTAHAMMKFQLHMGIASATDGSVGPLTRGFFERRCGRGLGHGEIGERHEGEIAGSISAVATSSITVSTAASTTRIVNFTASTTIEVFASATSSSTTGSAADLVVGRAIRAEGVPNPNGNLDATEIKVGAALPPPPPFEIFRFDKFGRAIKEIIGEDEDDNGGFHDVLHAIFDGKGRGHGEGRSDDDR